MMKITVSLTVLCLGLWMTFADDSESALSPGQQFLADIMQKCSDEFKIPEAAQNLTDKQICVYKCILVEVGAMDNKTGVIEPNKTAKVLMDEIEPSEHKIIHECNKNASKIQDVCKRAQHFFDCSMESSSDEDLV